MKTIWRVKSGLVIEVFLFGQGYRRNARNSSYYGIHKAEDGTKRILEWDLAGKCTYASVWFHSSDNLLYYEWNNTGPMHIDSFADLESYDVLLVVESEKIPLRRITNPILSLELE
jgi:hypothetical protein